MAENWMGLLQKELAAVYGPAEGLRVSMTVLPGIAADFKKMLEAAAPEEEVSETYHLEDRKAEITLRGRKTQIGSRREKVITGLEFSGRKIALAEPAVLN